MRRAAQINVVLAAVLAVIAAGGCANPDAPRRDTRSARGTAPRLPGEPATPTPQSAAEQTPAAVAQTPERALAAFANIYINWSYETLSSQQQRLAGMSVGSARLAEQQAAASSRGDSTISAGHIRNSGHVVGISSDLAQPGRWWIVTQEQTFGGPQYQGLPASYHVTLARVATVPGGYAVSQWLPQS